MSSTEPARPRTTIDLTSRVSSGLFASQPAGLPRLFFTELWERFSYYGMRALLTLFMVTPIAQGGLALSTPDAAQIYGNYTMAVYMLSIPGGFIADRILGARRSVLVGGWIIALGHYCLAYPSLATFYTGLVLIALGTGLFKPNISGLVGALYAPGDERRDAGFSIFYMGVNIGAFIAPLVTGFLAQSATFKDWLTAAGFDPTTSWHWGFGAAGVGMTLAMLEFMRSGHVLEEPVSLAERLEGRRGLWRDGVAMSGLTLGLLALAMLSDMPSLEWLRWMFLVLPLAGIAWCVKKGTRDHQRLAAIGVLFIAAMVFFAIFEQMGTSMSLFADRLTVNSFFGLPFPSSYWQAVNPIFVVLLAPMFALLWLRLGRRQPSAAVKFAFGLALVALSFAWMIPAAKLAAEGKVSPIWLAGLFFLQTSGELLLSPVGLSSMTKLAPARMTGFVLGLWFLATAFGNKLAGVLGGNFQAEDPAALVDFFATQALWVALAAALMLAVSRWVNRLSGEH
ncbi:MAG: peptide MFS transporter [Hyphomicrobiaceae bacterium]